MRPPVTVRRVRWLWPRWAVAQVPAPRLVLLRRGVAVSLGLMAHELAHVLQWERYGPGFALRYLWAHVRHGYVGNPYEVEADRARSDPAMLAWAGDVLAAAP